MPINKESLNRKLEKALGRYNPKAVNDQDEVIPLADEADAFRFNFTKDGQNYGVVYATLDDTNTLTIWFDDEIMDSPDSKTPGLEYDDTWFGFLKFIKRWAMNNQLSFKTDNKDHLGGEMARRKRMKEKEKIAEGYYPMGKKASYSDAVPSVKIVLQHSKVMQEGEQRFRHIEKIFVENANGERFLVPTTKPGLARVFARHIAEGGTPYDERASHIQSLVEEYNKMAGFVRATRNGQFNESAQQLVQEGINHYLSLRESLGKLTGHRGYTQYFENWTPALMEDDTDTNALNELFVQETLDPRIESVMPILSRLHKQVAEMKEVGELSEWADTLLSEKMVMGADTDASSGGTVNAYIEEDEGIQSQNPEGIPEGRLDGSAEIDSPVANAITHRILMQRVDLLSKYGPEKVADAISTIADDLGDWIGPDDEIGSSDVSGWVKRVEQELSGGQLEESHMSEVDMILQDVINGDLDAYDVMNHPKTPEEEYVANILQQEYEEVSRNHRLHPDDDFEQILDIVVDNLAKDYGHPEDPSQVEEGEIEHRPADLSKINTKTLQSLHALHRHYGQKDPRSKEAALRGAVELKKRGIVVPTDESVEEGLGDVVKKVGGALKAVGKKAADVLGGPDDEELLRDLKKKAGVRNPQTGKPSMAYSDVEKVDEVGVAEQYDRSVDIGQQMANDGITYSPERENEIIGKMAEYMKRSGFSSKEIRYLMNYDEDYISDQLGYLPREKGVAEDLDANQKRVGQLGPTEKVGKKGAVGKLVGANESSEHTKLVRAITTRMKDEPQPQRKPKDDEEAASWERMRRDKEAISKMGDKKKVTEMDSEGYKGTRDEYELGKGKEGKAKPITAKKAVSDAEKIMNKAYDKMMKSMSNKEKADKGWRNPDIKEGQEDLEAILRIIKK